MPKTSILSVNFLRLLKEALGLQQKWQEGKFPYHPPLLTCITNINRAVPLKIKQGWTILTHSTKVKVHNSPRFPFNETNSVPHSMDLDKSLMTYNHHYNVIESIFTAHRNFCIYVFIFPSLPSNSWHWSFCHHSFVFSRMAYRIIFFFFLFP